MIGIVVVSHSRALAEGAVGLAAEMVGAEHRPAIEIAAGLDAETFGTDATAVAEAITRADSGAGVLVLLDLGSAVLSAEMALEFLDPDLAGRVRLSGAPLVEGLVAAVVAAGAGADLDTAGMEAEQGLAAKAEHLGPDGDSTAKPLQKDGTDQQNHYENWVARELVVTAPHGLHARPAARLVQAVGAHPGVAVRVRNLDAQTGPVDGRSLTGIATLGARQGHRIEVSAAGDGADALLDELAVLADQGFGDTGGPAAQGADGQGADAEESGPERARRGPTYGLDAAIGRVRWADRPVDLADYRSGEPEEELRAWERAVATTRAGLTEARAQTAARLGEQEAGVFDAHLALLRDPRLQDPVRTAVAEGSPAPQAVTDQITVLRDGFAALPDSYQRDRAQDVTSVGDRLLRALAGDAAPNAEAPGAEAPDSNANAKADGDGNGNGPTVLVATELDPATALGLDVSRTVGILTLSGGATGHGVLLARARGVPVLTGQAEVADIPEGTLIAFDVRSRRVEVAPGPAVVAEFEGLLAQRERERREIEERAGAPAVTTDGHRVWVKANLGAVAEAAGAAAAGADGSGLVRTEAVFGAWQAAPTVPEQVAAFEAMALAMQGRPLTIRTWDVGGDKPVPFLDLPQEANPFLGVRGLRAFRAAPEVLVDQLEAVCRVAREHPVRVMFPMVTTLAEVDWALARLDEAAGRTGGRPEGLEVGIMVEVPAAALRAGALSARLDFVSIGSNDLTQYVLAAERGNPALAELADAADPAVLHLVRATCAGVAEGVRVGLCGDAASDPELAPVLVGLGVTELSASAAMVPVVKDALRRVSLVQAQGLAQRALRTDSAAEVRALLARGVSGPRAGGTGC